MARRVLLNSSGLKVSQAGVDVLSANAAQLLFSSDWSALSVVQSGSYTVNSWSGGSNYAQHSGSISLSKTYAAPPFIVAYLLYGGAGIPIGMGFGGLFGVVRSSGPGSTNSFMLSLSAGTTSIDVRAYYDKQATPSLARPDMTFQYFVFDFGA